MKKKITNFLGSLLLLIGIFIFFSPDFFTYQQQKNTDFEIEKFRKQKITSNDKNLLYQKARRYNQKIYNNKQDGMKDAWSYKASMILSKDKSCFGYIKIKKMNVRLPLYLGATQENMKKGAAVLGQTSLPIGTENSNCVIAAHRGYRGIPYFREIEKLEAGDKIIIKNPWEKLIYQVEEIKLITADDFDQIKIQKGKDIVTLLTCHPYREHGKYRYVVYCARDNGQKISAKKIEVKDNIPFESSKGDILREKIFRYIGIVILIFFIIGVIITKQKERRRKCEE